MRQTEQAFIAAATALFAEKGYNGTSISDVAQQLGLTTASLYYHVDGKQDLLLRVLETGMANFLDRLEAVLVQDLAPKEKLRLAVENHLDFVLTRQNAVAVFLRERRFLKSPYREQYEARVDRYDQLFTTLVQEAMDAGEIPPGEATLVRLSILGMINWAVEWYDPAGRFDQDKIIRAMSDLIMVQMLALPGDDASTKRS
ncbi:MAG: TetR/AcrR family transcriptional regulator [Nocardioidaceae bacterium]